MANDLEQYLNNQNVRKFLDLISLSEGTYYAKNPYAVYGGNVKNQLTSLAAHPGRFGKWQFPRLNGAISSSTASGRYQMINGTWRTYQQKLGLTDFGPRNQDLAAIGLIRDSGALQYVLNGDFRKAADILGRKQQWASFPSSTADQAKRSNAQFEKFLRQVQGNAPSTAPMTATTAPQGLMPATDFKPAKLPELPTSTQPTQQATMPTGLSGVESLTPNLNKDEWAAIIQPTVTVPTVTEQFFVNQPTADWKRYYE